VRRFGLRTGDIVEGEIRAPKDSERYFALLKVGSINNEARKGPSPHQFRQPDAALPGTQNQAGDSEDPTKKNNVQRVIELTAPIGFGQRALIVAPPRTGKTVMLQNIASSIAANHPDAYLIVLLIDERPEEVTDMARSVRGEVFLRRSTNRRHVTFRSPKWSWKKPSALVEHKRDVIILLDSITRLARAYNTVVPHPVKS
jgi:transcription termination factor Rho